MKTIILGYIIKNINYYTQVVTIMTNLSQQRHTLYECRPNVIERYNVEYII